MKFETYSHNNQHRYHTTYNKSRNRTLAFERALAVLHTVKRQGLVVDQAVFRSMFIATQRLGRNVSEAAYAVHRVMKEMNVEANALTFGQYAQSLNQGKAVRALSSDDSEKKKSPTQKLKDVCSSKSFRAMMNKNKNTERKYVVQMFGEKSVVSDTKKKILLLLLPLDPKAGLTRR